MAGEQVKDLKLAGSVFAVEPHKQAMFNAVQVEQANSRQATAKTKVRHEVSGGGKKPWRQKGTGRARQGSTRAPHWRHGGVVFGPHPRDYDKKMNRKERRLALKSALAYKAINNELVVVDSFKLESSKTKEVVGILNNLKVSKNVLIVVDELDENMVLATRNLSNVILLEANEINVLDIISSDYMVITEKAIKMIEEVLV
jgi:large subunit ribosomal protein L4